VQPCRDSDSDMEHGRKPASPAPNGSTISSDQPLLANQIIEPASDFVDAPEIMVLHDDVARPKIIAVNVAETVPAHGEEMWNAVKASTLALAHFPVGGRKLFDAVNPLRADHATATLSQIPTVLGGYGFELPLGSGELFRRCWTSATVFWQLIVSIPDLLLFGRSHGVAERSLSLATGQ